MRFRFAALTLGALLLLAAGKGKAQETKGVDVQVVKYDGLKDAVLKNRGKVVVVDFWSTTSIPCIKNFPHMVEMQQKHGKEGLVVISVSLDAVQEEEKPEQRKERVLNRLRKLKADSITNLILDESLDLVQQKLRIVLIPSVYVFNRQGQWTHFVSEDGGEVAPKAVEDLTLKWLKEK
jgi:thiol-disulfide isomerase/thioredoxin